MKAVGIKNLKNNLSRYLGYVKEGEIVMVLDREEVVAEISKPTMRSYPSLSPWQAFLNSEEKNGSIILAKKKAIPNPIALPKKYDIDFHKILNETRADRF